MTCVDKKKKNVHFFHKLLSNPLPVIPDVTFAAKGYFDALVRMGELASESQGSKDLGKSFFFQLLFLFII